MIKHKTLFFLPLLCLSACGQHETTVLSGVDLDYYVAHLKHDVFRTAKKASVTIRFLKSDKKKTYVFTNIVWDEWMIWREDDTNAEYEQDYTPALWNFHSTSILSEHLLDLYDGNMLYGSITCLHFLVEDNRGNGSNSTADAGKIATKCGSTVTLYNQTIWRTQETSSEDIVERCCTTKCVYKGEKLSHFGFYVSEKFYFTDEDGDGVAEFHDDVFDNPLDGCEYTVSFQR